MASLPTNSQVGCAGHRPAGGSAAADLSASGALGEGHIRMKQPSDVPIPTKAGAAGRGDTWHPYIVGGAADRRPQR